MLIVLFFNCDQILYADTCFTAQALVRIMVDLNEQMLQVADQHRNKEEPRFSDVVAVFKLLTSQLGAARKLLGVRTSHNLLNIMTIKIKMINSLRLNEKWIKYYLKN